jgi:hypothetical protein
MMYAYLPHQIDVSGQLQVSVTLYLKKEPLCPYKRGLVGSQILQKFQTR